MNPDRAAELLQIPERGIELLQRFNEDEPTRKALHAIEAGFDPKDVAEMYGFEYNVELQTEGESDPDGKIFVYECTTKRCRQKGRVATSSHGPNATEDDPENLAPPPACPSCGQMMHYVMAVVDEGDIAHLRRTYLPRTKMADPLGRTDRGGKHKDDFEDND